METKDKKLIKIEPIPYNSRPKLLFIGNGINRCFDGKSWGDIIKASNKSEYLTYDDMCSVPFPMQIVLATNDEVDTWMKETAPQMVKKEYSDEEISLYKSLLELPFSDIVTTNYTYELETVLSGSKSGTGRNKWLKYTKIATKSKKDDATNWLYRCSECGDKRIWHIHGELAAPNHMVIGHYYYNKVSACIQSYIPELVRRCNYAQKNEADLQPESWVDKFMLSDVYMLGFGMDMSESDIWYLICCKKRNFPDTKMYFYTPDKMADGSKTEINEHLMRCYGVEMIKDKMRGEDYKQYYIDCIKDIRESLKIANSNF